MILKNEFSEKINYLKQLCYSFYKWPKFIKVV